MKTTNQTWEILANILVVRLITRDERFFSCVRLQGKDILRFCQREAALFLTTKIRTCFAEDWFMCSSIARLSCFTTLFAQTRQLVLQLIIPVRQI